MSGTERQSQELKDFHLCSLEQPDLDLNVATIHKHPFLWAIISKTKLIWSINLTVLEMSSNDLNTVIGFGEIVSC